jgi:CDP-diacylglycerol--glycerol-3-phosphate 3-phosphatidyltransferase
MSGAATLYQVKPGFQAVLRPVVARAARAGIRPNHLTIGAIAVSAAAGTVVAGGSRLPALLWTVPVLYLLRMALNAMDGLLAREHAMTSRRGAVLNEIGDVISDAVAYLPFAFLVPDAWLLVVLVVTLGLIAEVTALAAADESGRRNDGPLGKSDRALAFGFVAVLAATGADAAIVPALVVLVLLGIVTIRNRAVRRLTGEVS